jgi:hypothetical protein
MGRSSPSATIEKLRSVFGRLCCDAFCGGERQRDKTACRAERTAPQQHITET